VLIAAYLGLDGWLRVLTNDIITGWS